MSTVSGAAAGNPSGMTSASRTLGEHEHHWFTEPTEPAKKGYVTWLIIAQFVFFVALLGPAIVGIGLKVYSLQSAGAIAPDGAGAALAVLGGVGAFFATVANVVFGRISDRTTSKWGRRRIWIVLGTVVMTAAFLVMALAPNLAMATVGWALAQLGANITLAPFIATIADQVPKFQRGQITAAVGIAQNVGILGGTFVAQMFQDQLVVMFVGPSILAIAAMVIFAFVLPDEVLPVKPPRATFYDWWNTFWVSPRTYPDYALAWWSRFLITLASFLFTTFRILFVPGRLGVAEHDIAGVITMSVLIYTIALVLTSWAAGKLSDKIKRRKAFVWGSTAVFAIGTVVLAFIHSVPEYYVLEAFMGLAYGVYVGVDLALVVDVLPNPDDSGKDLGVFNIANALPQTFAPMIGGVLIYVGAYPNFDLVLWTAGVAALIGAVVIIPIKKVR